MQLVSACTLMITCSTMLVNCNITQGHNPNFNVSKALKIAQDMYGLKKYGGVTLKEASHCYFTNNHTVCNSLL
jgi:hypothetical protein